MLQAIRRFMTTIKGGLSVEYGLVLGFIAIAVIVTISTIGTNIGGLFDQTADAVDMDEVELIGLQSSITQESEEVVILENLHFEGLTEMSVVKSSVGEGRLQFSTDLENWSNLLLIQNQEKFHIKGIGPNWDEEKIDLSILITDLYSGNWNIALDLTRKTIEIHDLINVYALQKLEVAKQGPVYFTGIRGTTLLTVDQGARLSHSEFGPWSATLELEENQTFFIEATAENQNDFNKEISLRISDKVNYFEGIWIVSTYLPEGFYWKAADFPFCQNICGEETLSRDVTCMNKDDEVVTDQGFCHALEAKPDDKFYCIGNLGTTVSCYTDTGSGFKTCINNPNSSRGGTLWGQCSLESCSEGYYKYENTTNPNDVYVECVQDCSAVVQDGFSIPDLTHAASLTVTKMDEFATGQAEYAATATCNTGVVELTDIRNTNTDCVGNLVPIEGYCYQGCLAGSVQGYTHPTLIEQQQYEVVRQREIINGKVNEVAILQCLDGAVRVIYESDDLNSLECNEGYSGSDYSCFKDCAAGTVDGWFNHGTLQHNVRQSMPAEKDIPGGRQTLIVSALCLDGQMFIEDEHVTNVQCRAGYDRSGEVCNGPCEAAAIDGYSVAPQGEHGDVKTVQKSVLIDFGSQDWQADAVCNAAHYSLQNEEIIDVNCDAGRQRAGNQCLSQCLPQTWSSANRTYNTPLLDHKESRIVAGTEPRPGGVARIEAYLTCEDGELSDENIIYTSILCEAGKSPNVSGDACYTNCSAGTIQTNGVVFDYAALRHNESRQVSQTVVNERGSTSYIARLYCTQGSVSASQFKPTNAVCNEGYENIANLCKQSCDAGESNNHINNGSSSAYFEHSALEHGQTESLTRTFEDLITDGDISYRTTAQCQDGTINLLNTQIVNVTCEEGYSPYQNNSCREDCVAGTLIYNNVTYPHDAFLHNTNIETEGRGDISNGIGIYNGVLGCWDGRVSHASSARVLAECESGFSAEAGNCYANCEATHLNGFDVPYGLHRTSVEVAALIDFEGGKGTGQAMGLFSCVNGVWTETDRSYDAVNCEAGYTAGLDGCYSNCNAGAQTDGQWTYYGKVSTHGEDIASTADFQNDYGVTHYSVTLRCQDGSFTKISEKAEGATCNAGATMSQESKFCYSDCVGNTASYYVAEAGRNVSITNIYQKHLESMSYETTAPATNGTRYLDVVLSCSNGTLTADKGRTLKLECDDPDAQKNAETYCYSDCEAGIYELGDFQFSYPFLEHGEYNQSTATKAVYNGLDLVGEATGQVTLICSNGTISTHTNYGPYGVVDTQCDAGYSASNSNGFTAYCNKDCAAHDRFTVGYVDYLNIPATLHNKAATKVTGEIADAVGGIRHFEADLRCTNGVYSVYKEVNTGASCQEGFTEYQGYCHQDCAAGTARKYYQNYDFPFQHGAMKHLETISGTTTQIIDNGTRDWFGEMQCADGTVSVKNGQFITSVTCDEGYSVVSNACVSNCTAGTITSPAGAVYSYPYLLGDKQTITGTAIKTDETGTLTYSAKLECSAGQIAVLSEKANQASCAQGYKFDGYSCVAATCPSGVYSYNGTDINYPEMVHAQGQEINFDYNGSEYRINLRCNYGTVSQYSVAPVNENVCSSGYAWYNNSCYKRCYEQYKHIGWNIYVALGAGAPGELYSETHEVPATNGVRDYTVTYYCHTASNNYNWYLNSSGYSETRCNEGYELYTDGYCYAPCEAGTIDHNDVSFAYDSFSVGELITVTGDKITEAGTSKAEAVLTCSTSGQVKVDRFSLSEPACSEDGTAVNGTCYDNCQAGEIVQSGVTFAYPYMLHTGVTELDFSRDITNGTQQMKASALCENGTVSLDNVRWETPECETGFGPSGNSCQASCPAGSYAYGGTTFDYPALGMGETFTAAADVDQASRVATYSLPLRCNNGTVAHTAGWTFSSQECKEGYFDYARTACYRKCDAGTYSLSGVDYVYDGFQPPESGVGIGEKLIEGGKQIQHLQLSCTSTGTVWRDYKASNWKDRLTIVDTICDEGYQRYGTSCRKACEAGSLTYNNLEFSYGSLDYQERTVVSATEEMSGGSRTLRIKVECQSTGEVTPLTTGSDGLSEYANIQCDAGYLKVGTVCYQNCSSGSVDLTSQTTPSGSVTHAYNAFNHGQYIDPKGEVDITGGSVVFTSKLYCSNGTVTPQTYYREPYCTRWRRGKCQNWAYVYHQTYPVSSKCQSGYTALDNTCYSGCSAEVKVHNGISYDLPTAAHGKIVNAEGRKNTPDGAYTYRAEYSCSNGVYNFRNTKLTDFSCGGDYVKAGDSCKGPCAAGESSYNGIRFGHSKLKHGETESVSGILDLSFGGRKTYSATGRCVDGGMTFFNVTATSAECGEDSVQIGNECYLNCQAQDNFNGYKYIPDLGHGEKTQVSKVESFTWGSRIANQEVLCSAGNLQLLSSINYTNTNCVENYSVNSDGSLCFTCGKDQYAPSGALGCSDVGTGYYSLTNSLARYQCHNKPENAFYSGTGGGEDNCPWICDTGYAQENGQCVLADN